MALRRAEDVGRRRGARHRAARPSAVPGGAAPGLRRRRGAVRPTPVADDGIAADLAPALAGADRRREPRPRPRPSGDRRPCRPCPGGPGAAQPRPPRADPVVARLPLHGPRRRPEGAARRRCSRPSPSRRSRLDAGRRRPGKRAACAAYASQIGFQFGGEAGLDARLAREGGHRALPPVGRARLGGSRASMPAEPQAPKSLADPDALAARRALIGGRAHRADPGSGRAYRRRAGRAGAGARPDGRRRRRADAAAPGDAGTGGPAHRLRHPRQRERHGRQPVPVPRRGRASPGPTH